MPVLTEVALSGTQLSAQSLTEQPFFLLTKHLLCPRLEIPGAGGFGGGRPGCVKGRASLAVFWREQKRHHFPMSLPTLSMGRDYTELFSSETSNTSLRLHVCSHTACHQPRVSHSISLCARQWPPLQDANLGGLFNTSWPANPTAYE